MSTQRSRSVFVGNIPYEATEEQLKEIFSQVGEVVSFRVVQDRETGKPKGFGFCEYKDAATASSAMRNLNNVDVGGRQLRVDTASDKDRMTHAKVASGARGGPPGPDRPMHPQQQGGPRYGAPMPEAQVPTAIDQTIQTIPPQQLFDMMTKMKMLVLQHPDEARHLLTQNPQLCYALLMAQIRMKIVDREFAEELLKSESSRQQQQQQDPHAQGGPGMGPPPGPHRGMPGPPFRAGMQQQRGGPPGPDAGRGRYDEPMRGRGIGGPGYRAPPPRRDVRMGGGPPDRGGGMREPPRGGGGGGGGGHPQHMRGPPGRGGPPPQRNMGPPPQQQGGHMPPPDIAMDTRAGGPPPQQRPPAGGVQMPGFVGANQQEVLREVMNLSDAQIAALPPDQAELLMSIKRQIANQGAPAAF